MAQITQEELSRRLNKNGWSWNLISNLTPGIIRIQLADDGEEETNWRKCIEAPTLEQAVMEAEAFVESINAYDYGKNQPSMYEMEFDCEHEFDTDEMGAFCIKCGERRD